MEEAGNGFQSSRVSIIHSVQFHSNPSSVVGSYRFGLVHTTPKSKYALLLVTQREQLPSCTAFEEKELRYENLSQAKSDISLSPYDEKVVQRVEYDGKAWKLGVRSGMVVLKLDGWDGSDATDLDDASDGVKVVVRGNERTWQVAMLQCNVMSALRIATALAGPNQHHPVFWQKQISGNPDGESRLVRHERRF